MRCREYRDWIQRELDGDLSNWEEKELENHIQTCPACAQERAEWHHLSGGLFRFPDVEPPYSITDRVMERIAEEEKLSANGWRRKGLRAGGAAAAAVLVMLTLPFVDPVSKDQPTETRPSTKEKGTDENGEIGIQSQPGSGDRNGDIGIQSTEERPGPVSSPDGKYRATVIGKQVVIKNGGGKTVYRSRPWPSGATAVKMEWREKRQLSVWLRRESKQGGRGEIREIDPASKTESKSPWPG
ncbi:anti-sigma factor family protein [Salinithrix halophila]|uniref:Anti-sigma-W factor RsiW n=1 Tax=Salinithrix halophila TaxID=1485204 RepID=A0ABV8JLC9_9BACL